jgi:hypothetical protein
MIHPLFEQAIFACAVIIARLKWFIVSLSEP